MERLKFALNDTHHIGDFLKSTVGKIRKFKKNKKKSKKRSIATVPHTNTHIERERESQNGTPEIRT